MSAKFEKFVCQFELRAGGFVIELPFEYLEIGWNYVAFDAWMKAFTRITAEQTYKDREFAFHCL